MDIEIYKSERDYEFCSVKLINGKEQAFYRSTGTNSGAEACWFPCEGYAGGGGLIAKTFIQYYDRGSWSNTIKGFVDIKEIKMAKLCIAFLLDKTFESVKGDEYLYDFELKSQNVDYRNGFQRAGLPCHMEVSKVITRLDTGLETWRQFEFHRFAEYYLDANNIAQYSSRYTGLKRINKIKTWKEINLLLRENGAIKFADEDMEDEKDADVTLSMVELDVNSVIEGVERSTNEYIDWIKGKGGSIGFFHRHGENGIKRALSFNSEIQQVSNKNDLSIAFEKLISGRIKDPKGLNIKGALRYHNHSYTAFLIKNLGEMLTIDSVFLKNHDEAALRMVIYKIQNKVQDVSLSRKSLSRSSAGESSGWCNGLGLNGKGSNNFYEEECKEQIFK